MASEFLGDLPSPEWMEEAACKGTDPELWWPKQGASHEPARSICVGQCAVRTECLELCFMYEDKGGIWGGTSERERRQVKRLIHQGKVDGPGEYIGSEYELSYNRQRGRR